MRKKSRSPGREFWVRFFASPRIWFGLSIVVFLVAMSLLAPWLSPTEPDDMDIALRLMPPGKDDWFGRDLNGGSVLTAMLYGGRTSLYISFITVFLSVTVGAGIGLIAGYKRGIIDAVLMRTVDLLMAFPGILLAMAQLEEMLGHVAVAYEAEVQRKIQSMISLVEPTMIIFMAGSAGGIIAAVLVPMLSIMNQIR